MARYVCQGTYRDGTGSIVTSGTVSVYLAGTTTAASVYTASSGGTAAGSVTTDDNGNFTFYVDTSDYAVSQRFKITLSKDGLNPATYDYILIFTPSPAVSGPSSATNHAIPIWDGTGGGTLEDSTVLISTDGTMAGNADTNVPTEKAVKTYTMPLSYLDTDGTLAGNSDVKVASQKATKTYADLKIAKATNVTAITDTGIADGEIAVFNLSNKDIRTSNAVISTDGTLASDADTNIPTEKAVKTYVDGVVIAGVSESIMKKYGTM
jgi:hypothetical protein